MAQPGADPPHMPDAEHVNLSDDPTFRLLADVAFAAIGIGFAAWLLPRQLRQVRQLGGRQSARAVVAVAIVALVVSLQPELLDVTSSLALTILAVLVIFRTADVVRLTGGPSVEWRALAEGIRLQRLVAVHPDRRAAQHLPDVRASLAALGAVESASTARYIELIRATIFADPEGPGMADRFAALAVEESMLRRIVGSAPAFEGGLVAIEEAPVPGHLLDEMDEPDDTDDQPDTTTGAAHDGDDAVEVGEADDQPSEADGADTRAGGADRPRDAD
jgi:hypothetical protein